VQKICASYHRLQVLYPCSIKLSSVVSLCSAHHINFLPPIKQASKLDTPCSLGIMASLGPVGKSQMVKPTLSMLHACCHLQAFVERKNPKDNPSEERVSAAERKNKFKGGAGAPHMTGILASGPISSLMGSPELRTSSQPAGEP
jgi:hypothetical protein